jgi:hypothetical protein
MFLGILKRILTRGFFCIHLCIRIYSKSLHDKKLELRPALKTPKFLNFSNFDAILAFLDPHSGWVLNAHPESTDSIKRSHLKCVILISWIY